MSGFDVHLTAFRFGFFYMTHNFLFVVFSHGLSLKSISVLRPEFGHVIVANSCIW